MLPNLAWTPPRGVRTSWSTAPGRTRRRVPRRDLRRRPPQTRLGHFCRGVGLPIYEGYGLTETSAAITINRVGELEVGTVGKLVPGNTMAVAADGELLVRGGVVFGGYWQNERPPTRPSSTAGSTPATWQASTQRVPVDHGPQRRIIVTAGRQERRTCGSWRTPCAPTR